jgi:hypothetical protein
MRVYWEVDDGYVGKSAPQYTDISDDDILECETDEEAMELITDSIQEDFNQKIRWYFRSNKEIDLEVCILREKNS